MLISWLAVGAGCHRPQECETAAAELGPGPPCLCCRSGASADLPPSLSRDPLLSYLSSQARAGSGVHDCVKLHVLQSCWAYPQHACRHQSNRYAPQCGCKCAAQTRVHLQAAPRPSGASSSPGLAGVDVGQWEVQFNELQMKRLAGEGSFGKVR